MSVKRSMQQNKLANPNASCAGYALLGAWLIALIATLGALYASEILKMPVCALCWDQRVFIFPFGNPAGYRHIQKRHWNCPLRHSFSRFGRVDRLIPLFGPEGSCLSALHSLPGGPKWCELRKNRLAVVRIYHFAAVKFYGLCFDYCAIDHQHQTNQKL